MGRSRFLPVVVSARGSGPGRRGEPDRRTGHAGAGGRRKRRRFAARHGDDRRSARRPWRIIPGPAHPGCNDSGMSCDNIVSRPWHPRPGRAAEPGHAGIRFMAQAEGEACRLSPAGADLRGGRDGRRPACSALRIQTRPVGAGERVRVLRDGRGAAAFRAAAGEARRQGVHLAALHSPAARRAFGPRHEGPGEAGTHIRRRPAVTQEPAEPGARQAPPPGRRRDRHRADAAVDQRPAGGLAPSRLGGSRVFHTLS
ncbi:hypothetical protein SAMN04244548_04909 [Paracoccus pantotrophus]|nr:hypothetical protein SAMN04244548_04909 [Paracoccus pantotrophus]